MEQKHVPTPETEHAIARAMTALSHPRRVRLFAILETIGPEGAGFEALRRLSGLTATSLRHHLRPMQAAGLVVRRRNGPNIAFRLHGRAAARAMTEMTGRINGVRPAHRAFAQKPPLN